MIRERSIADNRREIKALIEAGELGHCEECDGITADKDEDGEWCCEDCCDNDDAETLRLDNRMRANDMRRA